MAPTNPTNPALPRYLEALWGIEPDKPRRGPKPTVTVTDIGRAAVALADNSGWEMVSMKAIAESLGMTTMSLYRYVESKDDIGEIMVDEGLGPANLDYGKHRWRASVAIWADAFATRLRSHPWLATMPMARPPLGPNALSWTEAGVRAFDDTPLSGQQKMSALLLVDGFVRNHIRQASQMGLIGPAPRNSRPPYETMVASLADPRHHRSILAALASMDPAAEFDDTQLRFGLSVLLDGLDALIA